MLNYIPYLHSFDEVILSMSYMLCVSMPYKTILGGSRKHSDNGTDYRWASYVGRDKDTNNSGMNFHLCWWIDNKFAV